MSLKPRGSLDPNSGGGALTDESVYLKHLTELVFHNRMKYIPEQADALAFPRKLSRFNTYAGVSTGVIGEPDLKIGGGYLWIPLNRTSGTSGQVVRVNKETDAVTVIDLTDGDIGAYAGCWNPDNECFYTVAGGRLYKISKGGTVTRGGVISNIGNLELVYAGGSIWVVGGGYLTELDPETLTQKWQSASVTEYQRQIVFDGEYLWSAGWNALRRVKLSDHTTDLYNLNLTTGGGEVFCGCFDGSRLWFIAPDNPDAPKMNVIDPHSPANPATPTEIDVQSLHADLASALWAHCMCSDGRYVYIGFWNMPNLIVCLDPLTLAVKTIPAGAAPTAAGKVHGIATDGTYLYWAKADVAQTCHFYRRLLNFP